MNEAFAAILALGAVILVLYGIALIVRRYLEVNTGNAILIFVLALLAGIGVGLIRAQENERSSPIQRWAHSKDEPMTCVCAGLLTLATIVFLAKLHTKWIGGRLTDTEKKPGLDGARAWLSASNIICVALISLLAWLAFDYHPISVAILGMLALLAYPGLVSVSAPTATQPPSESHATERQRVLNMLDAGKITSAECAELLTALNYSEEPRVARPAAHPQKMAIIGAALLLVGFFLPWFTFNPQTELDRMARKLPIDPNWTQHFPWGMGQNTDTIRISGGDIGHGLGWMVLFLGVAAAALPYFAVNLPQQTRQRAVLAGLGAGAIILLYLVTENLRFVSVGILLAAIGYGLQLAGALQRQEYSGLGS